MMLRPYRQHARSFETSPHSSSLLCDTPRLSLLAPPHACGKLTPGVVGGIDWVGMCGWNVWVQCVGAMCGCGVWVWWHTAWGIASQCSLGSTLWQSAGLGRRWPRSTRRCPRKFRLVQTQGGHYIHGCYILLPLHPFAPCLVLVYMTHTSITQCRRHIHA